MEKNQPSRLRELRTQRGLKAEQVAKILNMKTALYWTYERNLTKLKGESLIILADYFGVSIDYFYDREKKEQSISRKELDYIKMIRGFSRENKKMIHQLILMINENETIKKNEEKKSK